MDKKVIEILDKYYPLDDYHNNKPAKIGALAVHLCSLVRGLEYDLNTERTARIEAEKSKERIFESHDKITTELLSKIKVLEARLEKCKEQYKALANSCAWYADKGTEQERHHFLKVEALGDYDTDMEELEQITEESCK